jgi:hypothetical protein
LGWATVIHPFHPLLGKSFLVLKLRKVGGREVLSLFDEHTGTVALPREWTDQAPPSPYASVLEQAPVLHVACLLKLQELVQLIGKRIDDAKQHGTL